MKISQIAIAFIALVSASGNLLQGQIIYQTVGGNSLATIDTQTGASNVIGSFGYGGTYGNAFDLDGTLYATTSSNTLSTVNLATGAATVLGSLPENMYAIDIDSQGVLYGLSWSGRLFELDKANGVGTLIGNTGIGNTMDIAFDSSDNLYATVGGNLYKVDKSTGSVLSTTAISIGGANMGIMFDANDTLWATTYTTNSGLYTMDVNTGFATLQYGGVGYYAHGGDFMMTSVIPEPATVGFLGIVGMGCYLMLSHRRRSAKNARLN